MCFDYDALPPELPGDLVLPRMAGGAAAELVTLRTEDGHDLAAAVAETDGDSAVGVIILPDVRGLFRFYVELAERFAMAGRPAIAVDYFARTAGAQERDADFDFMAHLPETTPAQVQADIAVAREELARRTGASAFVTLGFCFGGAQSYIAATNGKALGLDAAVGFYGTLDPTRMSIPFEMPAPLAANRERQTEVPVLALFGGADQNIPAEDVAAYEQQLTDAGVDYEIKTYEGAPHSFFDRQAEAFADASEDAWRRVLSFLDGVAAKAPAAA